MIELLTKDGQVPLMIGDDIDMDMLTGIEWSSDGKPACLVYSPASGIYRKDIDVEAAIQLREAQAIALVTMAGDDCTMARLVYRNGEPDQPLDHDQVRAMFALSVVDGAHLTIVSEAPF